MTKSFWLIGVLAAILAAPGCVLHCVVEGQPVDTPAGPVPIERLAVGDVVWSADPAGHRIESRVAATASATAASYLRLWLPDGVSLAVTSEHPVKRGSTWVRAGGLRAGDLVTTAGGPLALERVERIRGPARVVDLSVEPGKCFFVNGLLVHNKSMTPTSRLQDLRGDWLGVGKCGLAYLMRLDEVGAGELIDLRPGDHTAFLITTARRTDGMPQYGPFVLTAVNAYGTNPPQDLIIRGSKYAFPSGWETEVRRRDGEVEERVMFFQPAYAMKQYDDARAMLRGPTP